MLISRQRRFDDFNRWAFERGLRVLLERGESPVNAIDSVLGFFELKGREQLMTLDEWNEPVMELGLKHRWGGATYDGSHQSINEKPVLDLE